MKARIARFGSLIAWTFVMTGTTYAASTDTKQTMASGPDVYRVEVKNLKMFEVQQTGDGSDAGELHKISVRLSSADQKDTFNVSSLSLKKFGQNWTQPNPYMEISRGDLVTFGGRELPAHETRNLWIHSKVKYTHGLEEDAFFASISVTSRDLDCRLDNVCNRGDTGVYRFNFHIPKFHVPPSNRCGANNTFKLIKVDGKLSLLGLDGAEVGVSSSGDGPLLQPIEADICIASTVKPENNPYNSPRSYPSNPAKAYFLSNKAGDMCMLVSGVGGVSKPVYPITVQSCQFQQPLGNAGPQKWYLDEISRDIFAIRNANQTSRCLNLKKSVDDREGGSVKAVGCSGHRDQQWRRIRQSGQEDKYQNISTAKCLTLGQADQRQWGSVTVSSCADTPDQEWITTDAAAAAEIARWR